MQGPLRSLLPLLVIVMLGDPSGQAAAQAGAELQRSREQLEGTLSRLEGTERSSAYSEALRAQARQEAGVVRGRLTEGDFQVGDRIALSVEGEPELTGEFPVGPGLVLPLPMIGAVPLQGVLRSELNEHLEAHLRRFIRDPVVQARSLIRISVLGAVNQPGFYLVSAESLVADALMRAGGPARDANLGETVIVRGEDVIWRGEALQKAMVAGQTMDQMNFRAGDEIVVPQRRERTAAATMQILVTLITTTVLLLTAVGGSS